jgi:site-specific recombinase XerD
MSALAYTEYDLERDHAKLRRIETFGQAIDNFIGELARQGKSHSTRRSYRRQLNHFARLAHDKDPRLLTLADYERFLDRWTEAKPSTLASAVSLARSFSRFLFERGIATTDVAYSLKRPRRPRPEDVDVITVSTEDVLKMLAACQDMQELLCLASAIYLGARRAALSRIRRSHVDLVQGTVRILDKGGKVSVKPLPDEYQAILVAAERDGFWQSPEDYLIPNRRPASVKRSERSDKIVWETVKRVAARAGVKAHVHALRAAFAVAFDSQHPDEPFTLRDLMGHSRIETTLVYLRRRDKAKAMEKVRDLTWGLSERGGAGRVEPPESVSPSGLSAERRGAGQPRSESPIVPSSQPLEAHTGFEPVPPKSELQDTLLRRLRELTTQATRIAPPS